VTAAIESTALNKQFGHTWALRDCSLSIPAGRIVALVGPNGAGKTTLLNLAVGLLYPSSGAVRIFGRSPRDEPANVLARTGFLAQERPLYRHLTVAQTLEFGRALNSRWDQDFATARLDQLRIPLGQRVGKLSGGQHAQVALTLVLAKRPDLLLLDEPTSNLDPVARREFTRGLLDAAASDGLTIVISSHIVAELERFCDYLILLAQGQVQLAGDIEDLLSRHAVLYGDPALADRMAAHPAVVGVVAGRRQAMAVVRRPPAVAAPGWDLGEISLEDLVIAYMENPAAGTLPPPAALVETGP
jgi:ABC-2 type transport system ATP-binding protein